MFGLIKPNFSKVKKMEIKFITQVFESAVWAKIFIINKLEKKDLKEYIHEKKNS